MVAGNPEVTLFAEGNDPSLNGAEKAISLMAALIQQHWASSTENQRD
jgi:hypothetical protein